eukprot:m.305284 g.305284  ORF g.305284 m.305284 type:complete len:553 (+) comp16447_c0_seq2:95-1753(+)
MPPFRIFKLLLLLAISSQLRAEDLSVDVVVYGATPAGVIAAVGAAQANKQLHVLLATPSMHVGGCMSGGLGVTDLGVHPNATIGASTRDFFKRVAEHYAVPFKDPDFCEGKSPPYTFEPHVAKNVFLDMLKDYNVTLLVNTRIVSFNVVSGVIQGAKLLNGSMLNAKVFVDATYEGSAMKMAGISYVFGRESVGKYNESVAGVLPEPTPRGRPYGHTHQFEVRVNPYTDATNTTCLPHITSCNNGGIPGQGDLKIGAYDWRVTLTTNTSNMVPIPEPDNYDPAEFELLRRIIIARKAANLSVAFRWPGGGIPNLKTDWKVGGPPGFTGEYVGGSWEYPNATYERQQEIVAEHKRFILALLHFYRTDPVVPEDIRSSLMDKPLGLPKDEYVDTGHWSPQLYVREALRMVGEYVMTQHDILNDTTHRDSIALGSYTIDIPGAVQREVLNGTAYLEGDMQCPSFCVPDQPVYAIPYRSITPKSTDVTNMLVPVALSASHVAFSAIRMEPQWMSIGQAAGVAAAIVASSEQPLAVQQVNVTDLQSRLRSVGQLIDP